MHLSIRKKTADVVFFLIKGNVIKEKTELDEIGYYYLDYCNKLCVGVNLVDIYIHSMFVHISPYPHISNAA